MHIPDGFLTNRVAISLDMLSSASILYAARRIKLDASGRMVPIMGVLAAFVFAAQMFNFPILGGTSGHLMGGALLSILLGPMAGSLTLATVIIAQALFLQDGGLIALGTNIFNIGAVASFAGYAVFRLIGGAASEGRRRVLAGFLAGWISLLLSSACCALELALSGAIPLRVGLPAMVGYNAIVGVVEGGLTAGVLTFLSKVRPDLLRVDSQPRFGLADGAGAIVFVAIPIAILALAGSSSLPDPLEKLLAAAPLTSVQRADLLKLSSTARYLDYLIRTSFFVLLIGIVYLVSHFARDRRSKS